MADATSWPGLASVMDVTDPVVLMYLDAAKAWLAENTTYEFAEDGTLDGGAKAFLVEYCRAMAQGGAVQSESISQNHVRLQLYRR